jgi:hypothetical protein
VIVNNGGTLRGIGTIGGMVIVNAGGTLEPGNSPGAITVGALNILPGGTLNLAEGEVVIAPNGGNAGTSVVHALNITGASALDLNNNDLIVRAAAATKDAVHAAVQADIVAGQNGVDVNFVTNWDGPGIASTRARTTNVAAGFDLTTLGVIRNSDLDITTGVPGSTFTNFGGQPVTPDDVLVKYTYTGDGNLDGAVTFDDYAAMDSAFFGLIENLGWATGDINFDGDITFDDYSVVDQAFFFQGAPLSHPDITTVPEPQTWLMLLFALALALVFRLRRVAPLPFQSKFD